MKRLILNIAALAAVAAAAMFCAACNGKGTAVGDDRWEGDVDRMMEIVYEKYGFPPKDTTLTAVTPPITPPDTTQTVVTPPITPPDTTPTVVTPPITPPDTTPTIVTPPVTPPDTTPTVVTPPITPPDTTPTIVTPPAKYAVTVNSAGAGASGGGSYEAGETVNIKAGTAPSGQQFKNWTTTSADVTFANANSVTTTFTMPSNAVAVTANFEEIPTYSVMVISEWSGVVMLEDTYAVGETVTITAVPAPEWQKFKNWTTYSAGVTLADANNATTTFTMPSNAVVVTAVFEHSVVDPTTVVKGTFTDSRDNKTYKTVKIGSQVWMAENLNYDTADGKGSWCYNDDNSMCNEYGRLYDYKTAMSACPAGWHLSSSAEWDILVAAVGGKETVKKLTATNGWIDYQGTSVNGTDDYGFSALPGGACTYSGNFYDAGEGGIWWTIDRGHRAMYYYYVNVDKFTDTLRDGLSVRCVQD